MSRAAALLVAPFLLAGCGARSSLTDAVSRRADAGPVCDPGTITSPIFTIDEPDDEEQSPSLAPLVDGSVALAVASRPVNFVQSARVKVGAFDAWGPWPPAAPALSEVSNEFGGMVFGRNVIAAPSRVSGPAPTAFALLATGPNAELLRALATDGTGGPDGALQWVGDGLALAADATGTAHLVATSHPGPSNGGPATALDVAVASDQGTVEYPVAACATTPVAADAIASGDGFLLVAATGALLTWQTAETFCDEGGTINPANRLQISRLSATGTPESSAFTADVEEPVTRLRIAPRSVGAWVAWTTSADIAHTSALHFARLDAQDQIGPPAVELTAEGGDVVPVSLAVASLGDDLAVAVAETRESHLQVMMVRRFDEAGKLVWSREIAVEGEVTSPATLMLSPGGDELLVVWSEYQPDLFTGRVRVAKLGCLGGE